MTDYQDHPEQRVETHMGYWPSERGAAVHTRLGWICAWLGTAMFVPLLTIIPEMLIRGAPFFSLGTLGALGIAEIAVFIIADVWTEMHHVTTRTLPR